MHPMTKRICYALALVAVYAGSVRAGLLVGDPNASISGTESFSGGNPIFQTLIADVDYAVYAPGDFGTSATLGFPAAADPSGGTEWVYAYQINNDLGGQLRVAALSIQLVPGVISNIATNVSHTSSTPAGGLEPDAWSFIPIAVDPPTNVKWSFANTPHLLLVGLESDILLFTSPFEPTFRGAGITGGSGSIAPLPGDANFLPSPAPEPSALFLAALGGVLLGARYLRRRSV